jgi:hypothetical protein
MDEFLSIASEAVQFGFRALSKARWNELNTEYLAYRAKILVISRRMHLHLPPPRAQHRKPSRRRRNQNPNNAIFRQLEMSWCRRPPTCTPRTVSSSYETSTLRQMKPPSGRFSLKLKEAIDYVNFNKGMGSVKRFCVPIRRALLTNVLSVTCDQRPPLTQKISWSTSHKIQPFMRVGWMIWA